VLDLESGFLVLFLDFFFDGLRGCSHVRALLELFEVGISLVHEILGGLGEDLVDLLAVLFTEGVPLALVVVPHFVLGISLRFSEFLASAVPVGFAEFFVVVLSGIDERMDSDCHFFSSSLVVLLESVEAVFELTLNFSGESLDISAEILDLVFEIEATTVVVLGFVL